MSLKIVVDNKDLVAVDKPAGTLSVPSRIGNEDTRRCIGIELQKELGHKLYPVHRLDFEVSGILVFAKNNSTQTILNQAFESRAMQKKYEAYTGFTELPERDDFHWQSLIVRGKKRSFDAPHGKPASTKAKILNRQSHRLHWHLWPETGRPHQLRWHLAKAGFPILGDALYGSQVLFQDKAIALRHIELEFPSSIAGIKKITVNPIGEFK